MLVPILFLVFCFILPFIVLNLSNRNNPYVKKRKRCTQSIEAHITDTDYSGPLSDLNGLGKNTDCRNISRGDLGYPREKNSMI